MTALTDAKTSAQRDYIAAENAYREAYAALRSTHSAAVADLQSLDLGGVDVLAWLDERTGSTKARLDAAEDDLHIARIEQLAIEDAQLAESQAAKAKRDAVRYADRLDEVRDIAAAALALAMRAAGVPELKLG